MNKHKKRLKKALADRDAFLKEHPQMAEYQKEIDRVLDKTTPDKRMEALSILIGGKTHALKVALDDFAWAASKGEQPCQTS